ncbi:MAG: CBS domain-containing protein [Thermotogota bacterium]|nr:CBS domain-containing protein [Thermotogota bacterium]
MKIITTHFNPDFDAFSSAVAAQRIYPDHEIVISGNLSEQLTDFLSIYFPSLSYHLLKKIELKTIGSLIVVDCNEKDRIPEEITKKLKGKLFYYDHHGIQANLKGIFKARGSCTTLMCEELKKNKINITSTEASFFATSIYRETKNFTLMTTTFYDLEIAGWLFSNNASLEIISNYVEKELTDYQQEVLETIIKNVESFELDGINVGTSLIKLEKFPSNIVEIVENAWRQLGYDNLVLAFSKGRKMIIIARYKREDINFKDVFKNASISVHPYITYARVEVEEPETYFEQVKKTIKENAFEFVTAEDIMSTPVRTVLNEMPVREASKIMENTGHSGLPVIKNNKVAGVITLKDVQKAMKHELKEKKVEKFMNTKLVTVKKSDSVNKALQKMVENDVGRVLVLDEGILSGIITRTDIMRNSFISKKTINKAFERKSSPPITVNVKELLETRIPSKILTILRFIGIVGSEINMPVYVVGGFVRDVLLNRENFDIDIVVEGDSITFTRAFKKYFDVKTVNHPEFLTSSIFFKNGFRIDVTTARTEYYEKPAVLPNVDVSTIRKDLYRRDFSINAMAIKLNQEEFGLLYDFFGSRRDLSRGIIRALYNLSFVEDPTRILRAIRFEQRFGFNIEERTLEALKHFTEEGYIEHVTGQRIREELEKILEEPEPFKGIKRMFDLNVLQRVFCDCNITSKKIKCLRNAVKRQKYFSQINIEPKLFYIVVMILYSDEEEKSIRNVIDRYGLPDRIEDWINKGKKLKIELQKLEKPSIPKLYDILKRPQDEIIVSVDSWFNKETSEKIRKYFILYEKNKPSITGKDLIEKFNLKEGPQIREILNALYRARIEGLSENKEKKFVEEYLKGGM